MREDLQKRIDLKFSINEADKCLPLLAHLRLVVPALFFTWLEEATEEDIRKLAYLIEFSSLKKRHEVVREYFTEYFKNRKDKEAQVEEAPIPTPKPETKPEKEPSFKEMFGSFLE